jgi:L-serine dehydratase
MRAARLFALRLGQDGLLEEVARVQVELCGSLGATGRGHGSGPAVIAGLEGREPETVDPAWIPQRAAEVEASRRLALRGNHSIRFQPRDDLLFRKRRSLPAHPNGMVFTAWNAAGDELVSAIYYSVGGGFVMDEASGAIGEDNTPLPHPFVTAREMLAHCSALGCSVSELMLRNEAALRGEAETRAALQAIWVAMQDCVVNGTRHSGVLPGGLKVRRRAPELLAKLQETGGSTDPLDVMDWVTLYALAVNEENAAGGRIVTAPTNGAAGIIPAVLHYYRDFMAGADEDGVARFLLTAAAIGILIKRNASISGAEVGCQGEVGSACAMAAAGLAELMGGTPAQVENAAEIGLEHNLGLTCDPIGGLVQIPCIERNAVASVKAVNAARMALRGDGVHHVSLDKVIRTMRNTGRDMLAKYKETSRGGLAVNIIEC